MSRIAKRRAKLWNTIAVPIIEWTIYTIASIAMVGVLIGFWWVAETLCTIVGVG